MYVSARPPLLSINEHVLQPEGHSVHPIDPNMYNKIKTQTPSMRNIIKYCIGMGGEGLKGGRERYKRASLLVMSPVFGKG